MASYIVCLDATILKFYPQLDNFFKIYYIDRYCYVNNDTKVALCGKAYALGSSKAIIFRHGLQDNTASHELLHCIGLPHSFSSLNIDQWGFAFKEKMTDNIMDLFGCAHYCHVGVSVGRDS